VRIKINTAIETCVTRHALARRTSVLLEAPRANPQQLRFLSLQRPNYISRFKCKNFCVFQVTQTDLLTLMRDFTLTFVCSKKYATQFVL